MIKDPTIPKPYIPGRRGMIGALLAAPLILSACTSGNLVSAESSPRPSTPTPENHCAPTITYIGVVALSKKQVDDLAVKTKLDPELKDVVTALTDDGRTRPTNVSYLVPNIIFTDSLQEPVRQAEDNIYTALNYGDLSTSLGNRTPDLESRTPSNSIQSYEHTTDINGEPLPEGNYMEVTTYTATYPVPCVDPS